MLALINVTSLSTPADAHAVLLEKQPADGTILDKSPEEFALIFNEPVSLIKAQVFDSRGNELAVRKLVTQGEILKFKALKELSAGDFLVSYRLTSADGHPVAGAFQFRISGGANAVNLSGLRRALEHDNWRQPVLLARIIHYAGIIIAGGGLLFLLLVGAPKSAQPHIARIITGATWAGIIGGFALMGTIGAQLIGGGPAALLNPSTWVTSFMTSNGVSGTMALLGLGLIAILRPQNNLDQLSRNTRLIAYIAALLCALSFAGSGHVTTADPRWFTRLLLGVHALSATYWAGSIIPLFYVLRHCVARDAAPCLENFSTWGIRAVIALLIAGTLMTWIQIETFEGFFTDYGLRLGAKILMVLALLVIAIVNKIYLTPNLVKGKESAQRALRNTLGFDTALIAGIFIATSMLNMDPPPRNLNMIALHESGGHAHAGGHSAAFDFDLENKNMQLNVSITPNPDGTSSGKLTATDGNGNPMRPIEAQFMLSNPEKGIEPLTWKAAPASDGTLRLSDVKLPFAGNWDVRVDLLMDEFTKIIFAGNKSLDPQAGHKDRSTIDMSGMVANWNTDDLPRSCGKISRDISINIHAGRKYARPGESFGYNKNEWHVPKCARVTVTLVNEDQVRHQWMLHGLPRYQYTHGMFHIEANGGTTRSGTFIVPASDETYLIHCDMAQHMEKGLKGVFKVGAGSGDLPSVPNLTDVRVLVDNTSSQTLFEYLVIILASLLGLTGIWWVASTTRPKTA